MSRTPFARRSRLFTIGLLALALFAAGCGSSDGGSASDTTAAGGDTEASAEAATERMTVPVAVLLFGFLIFIAAPAVTTITSTTAGGPHP